MRDRFLKETIEGAFVTEGGSEFQRWMRRKQKLFNNLFERPIDLTGFAPPRRVRREVELLYLKRSE